MVLDVSGAELAVGQVVTTPMPGTGEEVRGYIEGIVEIRDDVLVRILRPEEHAGLQVMAHGASCTLQKSASGKPLVVRERFGGWLGFEEVEAA